MQSNNEFKALIIGRSNDNTFKLAVDLAQKISCMNMKVLYLTDKRHDHVCANLQIIDVQDITQSRSIDDLQDEYQFSLHKTLVTERSFFDYSSFRKSQCYSNFTLDEVYSKVTPYFNALDYIIREEADIIIEGLADNFMTSAAGKIAQHYKKPFYMIHIYYWFTNGFLMVDKTNQTSTDVDKKYRYYLENYSEIDIESLKDFYNRKVLHPNFPSNYTIKGRLIQLFNRFKSYEPLSINHWLQRRMSWVKSRILIRLDSIFERKLGKEKFVFFPLHVSPEATLLGSTPELADQFSLIKNISMNLPANVFLYVKEHPHQQVGLGLDYAFYKKIKSLPNVRLYDKSLSADSIYTLQNCIAVSVISGTVGLEAAMKSKPVFVFGDAIYGAGECFIKPKNFDEFFTIIKAIESNDYKFNEIGLYAILQALKESIAKCNVDFSKAKSWLELGYMVNDVTASFLQEKCKALRIIESDV